MGDSLKQCSICKRRLPMASFAKQRKSPDGRHYYCRECNRIKCKQWKAENRSKQAQYGRRWNAKNKHKKKAHNAYSAAVRYGQIEVPLNCSLCNKSGPVQAHHHDYSRPLDVEFLCRACHEGVHHAD